jgi:predicted metalloprotease
MNTPPPIQDITLRDYLAAAALTGLLSNGDRKTAVKSAYAIADDMIKARENDPS